MLKQALQRGQTGNAEVEHHLGVATTRNLTVITKLDREVGLMTTEQQWWRDTMICRILPEVLGGLRR